MGILDWWDTALGTFKRDSHYIDVAELKGQTFAVDLSIWMNKQTRTDIGKLAQTSIPPYPDPGLISKIKQIHNSLSEHITLVYVYDGIAPPHKDGTKEERRKRRVKAGKAWLELRNAVLTEPSKPIDPEVLMKATASRMDMNHPTAVDHANILKWMKEENIRCYGSIAEADQQMIKLEMDGVVDGIISEDGDEVALGARRLLCKMSRKNNNQYQFKLFDRDEFLKPENPYNSKLCLYPHLIVDAALMLGNDYCPRVSNNGKAKVIEGTKIAASKGVNKRNDDSMLDKLAVAPDPSEYIKNFGTNGKSPLTSQQADIYFKSKKYMLHAPVIEYDKCTGSVSIVPLNPLPHDVTECLGDYLGMPELNDLCNNKQLLASIYNCDVVPLTRKPLKSYDAILCDPIFGELDFVRVPMILQPTLCLLNWLRARGIDARPTDERRELEIQFYKCQRVNKQIQDPHLKPIEGLYDGLKSIASRLAHNKYDNPCKDYFSVVQNLRTINDDVVDEHLGGVRCTRPALRKRVKLLVNGGHYDPKTITCRNVETKNDGAPCILMICKCMSSKSSVMHSVFAVFEDKPNGRYMLPQSSCSCKKGEFFCSHSIGFLYLLSIMQSAQQPPLSHTQKQFEDIYRVNPSCVQSSLMLIENVALIDIYKTQDAQRKRKRSK